MYKRYGSSLKSHVSPLKWGEVISCLSGCCATPELLSLAERPVLSYPCATQTSALHSDSSLKELRGKGSKVNSEVDLMSSPRSQSQSVDRCVTLLSFCCPFCHSSIFVMYFYFYFCRSTIFVIISIFLFILSVDLYIFLSIVYFDLLLSLFIVLFVVVSFFLSFYLSCSYCSFIFSIFYLFSMYWSFYHYCYFLLFYLVLYIIILFCLSFCHSSYYSIYY